MKKRRRHSTITKDDVLKVVRLLRWVARFVLVLFFQGAAERSKTLESLLPTMEREGLLSVDWYEGQKIYSIARERKVRPVSMEHEITCALILVLLYLCRKEEGKIIPERAFRGFGIVPEAGISYSEERRTMLVIEYETRKDVKRAMKSKITRYLKYLPAMEAKFKRRITILFVIDVERQEVKGLVERMRKVFNEQELLGFDGSWEREDGSPGGSAASYEGDRFPLDPFFFIDYETFRSIPVGGALTARKYFWHDGKEWRLTGND